MEYILKVTFVGLASGIIGTGAGGLMAFFVGSVSNRTLSLMLEFSAGLMTGVVCFELVPEALKLGGPAITFAGIIIGSLAILLIENYIKSSRFLKKAYRNKGLLQTGVLTAIGIALYNFPEGFAIGSGFEASISLGTALTIVILIHDIPEGISTAVPLKAGGFSGTRAFLLTVLSGAPMGLGAFFGAVLGEISTQFISLCLGFAGGAMLYIVCGGLIPQSKKMYQGRLPSIGNLLGIICGIIVSVYN